MIDTHCHLNLTPMSDNPQNYIDNASSVGVKQIVVVGTDLDSSKHAIEISSQRPNIFAAVGIHPDVPFSPLLSEEGAGGGDSIADQLTTLVTNKKVVAIGECGLDYTDLHNKDEATAKVAKNNQKKLFGAQIQLAKKHNLPLIIHCRNTRGINDAPKYGLDSYKDLIDTLEHFSKEDGIVPKFVLHCMSGTMEYLQEGLRLGGFISFAGNVTYPNAGNLRALLHATPLDRLLLETDAPFLSPQSKRGQSNTPFNIKETYEFVAEELKIEFEKLEKQIEKNATQLFHL